MNNFKINIEKFDDWPPIIAIVDDRLKEEAVDVTDWDVNSYSCGRYQIKVDYWIDCYKAGGC